LSGEEGRRRSKKQEARRSKKQEARRRSKKKHKEKMLLRKIAWIALLFVVLTTTSTIRAEEQQQETTTTTDVSDSQKREETCHSDVGQESQESQESTTTDSETKCRDCVSDNNKGSQLRYPFESTIVESRFTTINISRLQEIVDNFFQLFQLECNTWASFWDQQGTFYHPQVPEGVKGREELISFCRDIQAKAVGPTQFRQDGPLRLTLSGSSLSHILVPYVYSTIRNPISKNSNSNNNNNNIFINSGWETIIIGDLENGGRILFVTEFFNRASLPFTWPQNN